MSGLYIRGEALSLRPLTVMEVFQGMQDVAILREKLYRDDMDEALLEAVCENAVLGYYALRRNGSRAFQSPKALLEAVTLDELAEIYEQYRAAFSRQDGEAVNGSFSVQCRAAAGQEG